MKNHQTGDELARLWRERMARPGLFNYVLGDQVETRTGGDQHSAEPRFVVQLNRDRGEKKRTGVEVVDIDMPFNENGFHFLKVGIQEILMVVPPSSSSGTRVVPLRAETGDSAHLLIINAAPIAKSHSLFLPRAFDRLPQRLLPGALPRIAAS